MKHGESGNITPINVVEQGHPPAQRGTTQEKSGSVVGSGTRPNAPKA